MSKLSFVLVGLVLASFAGGASAAPPVPVSVCVAGENAPRCYGGHDVCVGASEMVPACVDSPAGAVACGDLCQPPTPTAPVCLGYAACFSRDPSW